MVGYILFSILVIVLGVYVGCAIRRDIQTSRCPYCSCRDYCDIGAGIAADCRDEEQEPFVCKKGCFHKE